MRLGFGEDDLWRSLPNPNCSMFLWSRDAIHNSSMLFFCFFSILHSVLWTGATHLVPLWIGCALRRADEHGKEVHNSVAPEAPRSAATHRVPTEALPSPLSHAATFGRLLLWNNHLSHRHKEKLQTLSNLIL